MPIGPDGAVRRDFIVLKRQQFRHLGQFRENGDSHRFAGHGGAFAESVWFRNRELCDSAGEPEELFTTESPEDTEQTKAEKNRVQLNPLLLSVCSVSSVLSVVNPA